MLCVTKYVAYGKWCESKDMLCKRTLGIIIFRVIKALFLQLRAALQHLVNAHEEEADCEILMMVAIESIKADVSAAEHCHK